VCWCSVLLYFFMDICVGPRIAGDGVGAGGTVKQQPGPGIDRDSHLCAHNYYLK
jgi:hypothetical protein